METPKKRSDGQSNRRQETVVPSRPPEVSSPIVSDAQQAAAPLPKFPFKVDQFIANELLARGGMSVTFLGHVAGNPSDRIVVKVPLSHDPATLERFDAEIAVLRELDHPSIVRVRGAGKAIFQFGVNGRHGMPWLAMEYVSGQSLRQRITTAQTINWPEVRALLDNIVEALEYLHARHLCHRDIKPDNIIFDPIKLRWVLVDFGIAKSMLANLRLTLTLAAQDPGSWDYMSPEQLNGQQVDSRTDIYSLGKTAWESLIGKVPRVGTSPPSAALGEEKVPVEVDALILKMVAEQPEDRYQTPSEVTQALQIGALRIEQRKRLKKTAKRVLFALTTAAVAAIGSVGVWFGGDLLTTQRATALYIDNKESPTRSIHLLTLFVNDHRFWGRTYVDAKIAELGPFAKEERQRMLSEYGEVQTDLDKVERDEQFRLSRAQNFRKRYQNIFDNTEQYLSISQRASELENVVLIKNENGQVATTIDETKILEAKGQIKSAKELCDALIPSLRTSDAKQRLQARRAEILDAYISVRLAAIDGLARLDDPATLTQAEAQLEEIQQSVGATSEISKRQQTFDDALWAHYRDKAQSAIDNRSYNAARAYAQQYTSESRLHYHAADTNQLVAAATAAEDDNDWSTASGSGKQNIQQKAFSLALKDATAYQNKWPDGRHKKDALALVDEVASGHFSYLRSLTDIDAFNENFKVFQDLYPRNAGQVLSLRKKLCWIAHNTTSQIVADTSLTASVKVARLNGLNYKQCEKEKVVYIDKLVNNAVIYVQNPDQQHRWLYMHFWERPPEDCVRMPSAPTVYFVTITDISIEMSEDCYSKLKGKNDANPRLQIGYGKGVGAMYAETIRRFEIDGPINTRSFSASAKNDGKPIAFLLNVVDADSVRFALADADQFMSASPLGVIYESVAFKSGSKNNSFSWVDGTKISVSWTVQ